ncbi:class I SAM-dependent methyltransferase [Roseicella frigidaeris]|uniref:Methyltransferase type 11 domain-containing protein n=1 Tax=Roseicella frigidaeris TaxID=2230885 RepID=A0A327M8V9_9PROT|nr:class I SAM-dependent methyltransferase [Roseicella frigidaeris]RAI58762.1 hypothetical protein DOO78_11815 [Roseicella frigidaeris]
MRNIRALGRAAALRFCPPYRRLNDVLRETIQRSAALEQARAALAAEHAALLQRNAELLRQSTTLQPAGAPLDAERTGLQAACATLEARQAALEAECAMLREPVRIRITRGEQSWSIDPAAFETFGFEDGDLLQVTPIEKAAGFPVTWGDVNVTVPSHAIRVPARYGLFEFEGFRIPVHLISLTGAGPETFGWMGQRHVELYDRFTGLAPDMTLLEVGCGIGRDALQFLKLLDATGRYIGIDVTRDSILWCQNNITPRHLNFTFHHFDAENELYNPHGRKRSMDFALPVPDGSVDRIFLASVFTHLFEEEVLHYMREFARVLKPDGKVYASFFLHTPEALAAARRAGTTGWAAKFDIPLSDGVYANDPVYPRGAVAFTDAAMRRLIAQAGLRLARPYLKGGWSGLHADSDDGQDVAILMRAADRQQAPRSDGTAAPSSLAAEAQGR